MTNETALKMRNAASMPIPHYNTMGWSDRTKALVIEGATEIERLCAEVARLQEVIEADRSVVADGVSRVRGAIEGREWLREGRGSYSYDDDRWKDEFGGALDEIQTALDPLSAVARNHSDTPQTTEEKRRIRSTQEALVAEKDAEIERLREEIDLTAGDPNTRDRVESQTCTCGADGSGEPHEDWCVWNSVEPLINTLNACESYAWRMQHSAGHSMDRENAKAIIRVKRAALTEKDDRDGYEARYPHD